MWVRFTTDFDWKPKRSVTLAYKVGDIASVTRACGDAAIAANAAVEYKKSNRDSEPEPTVTE